MEAAVIHARLAVDINRSLAMEMLFTTDADQVHLTIRNLGAIEEVTLAPDGSAAHDSSAVQPDTPACDEPRQHMVFPFARLLLQSLGGQVVVNHGTGGEMECTLSLPCANGNNPAHQAEHHHAQIYAGLLTRMSRQALLNTQSRPC